MKTPEALLKESNISLKKLNEDDNVISAIYELIEHFNSRDIASHTGDELSRAAMRLSVLLVNLGQEVARASASSNAAYIYRKFKRAETINQLTKITDSKIKPPSYTKIDGTVDEKLAIEFETEIKNRHYADSIKTLYDDAERLVSVIQSRLRILTNEEIRSKTQQ